MPIEKIIVLEDDLIVRKNLEQQLRQQRYDVAATGTIAGAHELMAKDTFDLIFLDVRLPDGEGTDLLRELQSRPQKPLVVMVTGFGSVESAVECMRNGAFDYMLKPFSADQLEVTLKKAENFNQLLKVNAYFNHAEEDETGYELLGQSPAMENLRQLIRKVARTQATVLIAGESGTGKELVARALYRQSPRANAPFIKVNCAAIPENLIESEFFGHEKGAFTGAVSTSAKAASNWPTTAPFCSTKSAKFPPRSRPSSCASSRNANWNASAATAPSRWTCASSPPPTATSRKASSARNSGRTCFSASTSCPSTCRPCANARKTSLSWPNNSCTASPANTACASAAFPTTAWPR